MGHVSCLTLTGGKIYDPINQQNGVIADIWIRDGKIFERFILIIQSLIGVKGLFI